MNMFRNHRKKDTKLEQDKIPRLRGRKTSSPRARSLCESSAFKALPPRPGAPHRAVIRKQLGGAAEETHAAGTVDVPRLLDLQSHRKPAHQQKLSGKRNK